MWNRRNIFLRLRLSFHVQICTVLIGIGLQIASGAQSTWFVDRGSRDLREATELTDDLVGDLGGGRIGRIIDKGEGAQTQFTWLRAGWILFELDSDKEVLQSYEWHPWSKSPWVIVRVKVELKGDKIEFVSYPGRSPFFGTHVASLANLHEVLSERGKNEVEK